MDIPLRTSAPRTGPDSGRHVAPLSIPCGGHQKGCMADGAQRQSEIYETSRPCTGLCARVAECEASALK